MKKKDQDYKNEVSAHFKNKRIYLGLTQQSIADYFGVQRTSITNIEANRQCPPAWMYLKLNDLSLDDTSVVLTKRKLK